MKRYRHKDANYQRLGSAFVPSHKWGKRNKRRFERDSEWVKALFDRAKAPRLTVGADTSKWIWTAPNHTQYTTIKGPDGAEYIVTVEAAIRLAQPPTEPPSLEFTLPDVQDPKPFYSDAYEHKYRR